MTTATPIPMPRPSLPDDRLKDLDCMGFVRDFEPPERERWLAWMQRIRDLDRVAEAAPYALRRVHGLYHDEDPKIASEWSAYVDALLTYNSGYVVWDLDFHDRMLGELSGHVMRCAPGMPESLWDAAYAFGALDQFYNNLRDLQEDAERGMCWLPEECLADYGLYRDDIISGIAPDLPAWRIFMRSWLDDYEPLLWERSKGLWQSDDLPTRIAAMVKWTSARYQRIRRVMCMVGHDYRRFPDVYWAEVRRELGKVEENS